MSGLWFLGAISPAIRCSSDGRPVKQASTPKYNINRCLIGGCRCCRV